MKFSFTMSKVIIRELSKKMTRLVVKITCLLLFLVAFFVISGKNANAYHWGSSYVDLVTIKSHGYESGSCGNGKVYGDVGANIPSGSSWDAAYIQFQIVDAATRNTAAYTEVLGNGTWWASYVFPKGGGDIILSPGKYVARARLISWTDGLHYAPDFTYSDNDAEKPNDDGWADWVEFAPCAPESSPPASIPPPAGDITITNSGSDCAPGVPQVYLFWSWSSPPSGSWNYVIFRSGLNVDNKDNIGSWSSTSNIGSSGEWYSWSVRAQSYDTGEYKYSPAVSIQTAQTATCGGGGSGSITMYQPSYFCSGGNPYTSVAWNPSPPAGDSYQYYDLYENGGFVGQVWSTSWNSGVKNRDAWYSYYVIGHLNSNTGITATSDTRDVFIPANACQDFSISITPSSQTAQPGEAKTYTLTVNSSGGWPYSVDITSCVVKKAVSPYPTESTISLSGCTGNTAYQGDSWTFTAQTSPSTPLATYWIQASGTSNGQNRNSNNAVLKVDAPPQPPSNLLATPSCSGNTPVVTFSWMDKSTNETSFVLDVSSSQWPSSTWGTKTITTPNSSGTGGTVTYRWATDGALTGTPARPANNTQYWWRVLARGTLDSQHVYPGNSVTTWDCRPNLVVDSITFYDSTYATPLNPATTFYAASDPIYFGIKVKNTSQYNAGVFYVTWNKTTSPTGCSGTYNVDYYQIASLNGNTTSTEWKRSTSAPATAGSYKLGVYADCSGDPTVSNPGLVVETNENDNKLNSATYTVATKPANPTGLNVTVSCDWPNSSQRLEFRWTDNAAGETDYFVDITSNTNSNTWTTYGVKALGANATSFLWDKDHEVTAGDTKPPTTDGIQTVPINNTSYYWRVRAYNRTTTLFSDHVYYSRTYPDTTVASRAQPTIASNCTPPDLSFTDVASDLSFYKDSSYTQAFDLAHMVVDPAQTLYVRATVKNTGATITSTMASSFKLNFYRNVSSPVKNQLTDVPAADIVSGSIPLTINTPFNAGATNTPPWQFAIKAPTNEGIYTASVFADSDGNLEVIEQDRADNIRKQTYKVEVKSWFETTGGDVGSGTGEISVSQTPLPAGKYQSTYLAASFGNQTNVQLAPPGWRITNYKDPTTNIPHRLVPAGTVYDYLAGKFLEKAKVAENGKNPGDKLSCNIPSGNLQGFNYLDAINGCGGAATLKSAPNGAPSIIFIEGSLEVTGDIALKLGDSTVFIVSENITINEDVTQADGIYIAGGEFNDAGDVGASDVLGLTINGAVYANDVSLARILGGTGVCSASPLPVQCDNTKTPAEIINFVPKYLVVLASPDLLGSRPVSWKEIAP